MPNQKRTILVFAPGWGDPQLVINRLATRFKQELPQYDQHILHYEANGLKHDISEIANRRQASIKALRAQYDQMVFIGHSMGGLVGRALLDYVDFDLYVSLGTPHKGTAISLAPSLVRLISPSAASMAPGVPNHLPLPQCPSLTLQAAFDPLIWPQDSAHLPNSTRVKIPWTEHIALATSERAFWEMYAWIEFEHLDRVHT